jgi:hypothetical protein
MSVEVWAEDYDEACDIRDSLFSKLQEHPEVTGGPYEIDVEQTSGLDLEEEEE